MDEGEIRTIVKKAFEIYDADGSGFLEKGEIRKLLDAACDELQQPHFTEDQLNSVINTIDTDGDGRFSFEELLKIIGPFLKQTLN
eukprot:NODE_9663_length_361_cov_42.025641_g8757_i0.p1 GENE.NODE_9663_length_361_cov_42.025641_g8757_i0~~NODE_9663_length_361_cov_42.025641_g8757_i0.p1  ORF type:complete len:98 (+),score=23.41 NODE_9663_length_361_cov_42.025641_g8757_i0:42-296(+)